ncbi:MAG: hypothetical protein RR923_04940 [Bacilli bacterium]
MIYEKYLKENKMVDENYIIELAKEFVEENNINDSLNKVNLTSFKGHNMNYDTELKEIYFNVLEIINNIIKNSTQDFNQITFKTLVNINSHITNLFLHELIHAKQDSKLKEDNLVSKIFISSNEFMMNNFSMYTNFHNIIPVEYNAEIESKFEFKKICDNTNIEELKNIKHNIKIQKAIMDIAYTLEKTRRLSPVEKYLNITKESDRLRELKMCKDYRLMSEHDRILYGFPINQKTKEKILNLDNITNEELNDYFIK